MELWQVPVHCSRNIQFTNSPGCDADRISGAIGRNRHEDLGRSISIPAASARMTGSTPCLPELSCLRFLAIVILLVENDGPSRANRVLS